MALGDEPKDGTTPGGESDFSPLNVSVANIWRAFASARFQSRIRLIHPL